MSEFHIVVVKIEGIAKHPNADALEITNIEGYPVIMKMGDFVAGDTAIYVPLDSMVPVENPLFSFLKKKEDQEYHRIKAVRLRGIFSVGLLVKNIGNWPIGYEAREVLGIKKYVPLENLTNGKNEPDIGLIPFYDLEGLRKYHNYIPIGTEVVVTEKIHGTNAGFVFSSNHDRLFVKSHTCYKAEVGNDTWWRIAKRYKFKELLYNFQDLILYGEIYGNIQKHFDYGIDSGGFELRLFDILNLTNMKYLDYDVFTNKVNDMNLWYKNNGLNITLKNVPLLWSGKYEGLTEELKSMAEGNSTLSKHIKEGFVLSTKEEIYDLYIGRLKLKYPGEGYLLSKNS